jgi:hypothetical protein
MRRISQTSAGGGEVVAPVVRYVLRDREVPGLQFAQAHRDVGAGDAERLGDLLGVQRLGRDVEQGVDLPDGAVDAPSRAHLAEMEHEGLDEGGQVHRGSCRGPSDGDGPSCYFSIF